MSDREPIRTINDALVRYDPLITTLYVDFNGRPASGYYIETPGTIYRMVDETTGDVVGIMIEGDVLAPIKES